MPSAQPRDGQTVPERARNDLLRDIVAGEKTLASLKTRTRTRRFSRTQSRRRIAQTSRPCWTTMRSPPLTSGPKPPSSIARRRAARSAQATARTRRHPRMATRPLVVLGAKPTDAHRPKRPPPPGRLRPTSGQARHDSPASCPRLHASPSPKHSPDTRQPARLKLPSSQLRTRSIAPGSGSPTEPKPRSAPATSS